MVALGVYPEYPYNKPWLRLRFSVDYTPELVG
jgi:hypothetical protein